MLARPAIRAVAALRLVRLLQDDVIAEPARDLIKKIDPKAQHVGYVMTCDSCSSVWAAVMVMILPDKLVELLAVSEASFRLRTLLDSES